MAKTFSDFDLRSVPATGDFIIGYDPTIPAETRLTVKNLFDTISTSVRVSSVDTQVRNLTSGYTSTETVVEAASARWNSAYNTTNVISAGLVSVETVVETTSANWNSNRTTVQANSGNWNSAYTTVNATSANWNSNRTTVQANSGNWNSAYTTVNATSAAFGVVATLVATNSASWEESATIIPTVVAYLLTASNVTVNDLQVTNQIKAGSSNIPVTIVNTSTSRTFTNNDTNKIFHFDTTGGPLVAVFPASLTDGFNVALMNIGTDALEVSAANLKSTGTAIIDQFGSAYVYEQGGVVYAVGRLV